MQHKESVLQIEEIAKRFTTTSSSNGEVVALEGVSFSVARGECAAIVGPSGSGKSTLLNIIAGLDDASAGEVRIDNALTKDGKLSVGYIFQEDLLLPWRNVLENVMVGLEVKNACNPEKESEARKYLSRYGLKGFETHYPEELSQGMKQRVAFIRSLITEPKLLLLDEPFSALDYDVKLFLEAELLREIKEKSITALFVTHDIEEAIAIADRILIFTARPGRIKSEGLISFPGIVRDPISVRKEPAFRNYFSRFVDELRYGDWNVEH